MMKRFAGSARGALQEKAPLASYRFVIHINRKSAGDAFSSELWRKRKACGDFVNLNEARRKSLTGAFPRIVLFELLCLENLFFLKKGFQTFEKNAYVKRFRSLRRATKGSAFGFRKPLKRLVRNFSYCSAQSRAKRIQVKRRYARASGVTIRTLCARSFQINHIDKLYSVLVHDMVIVIDEEILHTV